MVTLPWRIIRIQGQKALFCLLCDKYSFNPNDIALRYCGYCGVWLATVPDHWQRPDEELMPFVVYRPASS